MKYIKYKRFVKNLNGDEAIQKFLDELITGGWNMIHYHEEITSEYTITITAVCGKYDQNNVIL